MPLAYIKPVGPDGLYHVRMVDAADPGYGVIGIGGGVDPGYGHGAGLRPDQSLPGGGHISNRPPMNPAFPDHTLPPGPPPQVTEPGAVLVLVRDPMGIWHYATIAPGSPPPRPVPMPPPPVIGGGPAQPPMYPTTGPINPPVVSGGPAPQPPPHPSGQPVPPMPTPTHR